MKILNFVNDFRFIDPLIMTFRSVEPNVTSDFVLVNDDKLFQFKNICSGKVRLVNSCDVLKMLDHSYSAVMLHSLTSIPLELIPKIPKSIKVFWFAWGFDMYTMPVNKPFIDIPLYHKLTKKAINGNLLDRLRSLHAKIYDWKHKSLFHKAVNRIDYFSGVLPIEYELMKSNPFFRAQRVDFNYFTYHKDVVDDDVLNKPVASGTNILIGNSGDPTNNHLDLYHIVGHLNIENHNVISFLSYGGTTRYKDNVILKGKEVFGDQYIYYENFLPFDEYAKVVLSCSNVIMGHERQQAMGNVYQSLVSGCKLFLSENSVAYKMLREWGFHIFSIQSDLNEIELNKPLPSEFVLDNRKKYEQYVGERVCVEHTKYIFSLIESF